METHLVRVLDPSAALTARGFAEHLDETLTLEVTEDPQWSDNVGVHRVRVSGGRAEVSRSPGRGPGASRRRLSTDIVGLAALYSGFLPVRTLARLGWVEGDEASLAAAGRLFDGPRCYVDQMY